MDSDLDPLDSQGGYFLYSFRLGLRDLNGVWGLTVHMKNAFDKLYKNASLDIPITPGGHQAQVGKPREFSVQLDVQF